MKIKLCIPIQAKTMKEAKKAMVLAKKHADMAEIWLDYIKDLDIAELLKNKPLPVICVCKKPNEMGCFKGSDKEVLKLLTESSKNGAEYIDLPLDICDLRFGISDLKSQFTNQKSKIILSYHNFKKTPSLSVLLKKAKEMKKKGADLRAGACIVKISVMAKTYADTIQAISLAKHLQAEKIPHIIIAMGKKGALSRILTPTLGGTIMFAPISKSKSSAPGQLTVGELKEAWGLLQD
ncbi:type I 3-dehydroquinate dehydratase [Candidatus Peregrinibacteria bacterium]|nr:type I 3-dehydroquinate dehydratase [Candidatus Peregrinibacteria bacterium]